MTALSTLIDATAEQILDAAKVDGLPLMGKLWTLSVEDDDSILLRIRAVNNRPVPRQPPPPPPPKPKTPPPPPPTKPGKAT